MLVSGDDFKDSSVLCTLLGIEPAAKLADSAAAALASCAQAGLEFDATLGSVEMVHTAEDMSSGNAPSLNIIACARIFRCVPLLVRFACRFERLLQSLRRLGGCR